MFSGQLLSKVRNVIGLFLEKIIHMAAVTVGCHRNNPHGSRHCRLSYKYVSKTCLVVIKRRICRKKKNFICMTTDSECCNVDYFLTEKSCIISQFEKWFPRTLFLIKSTLKFIVPVSSFLVGHYWNSWFSVLVWQLYFSVLPSSWSNTGPFRPSKELCCGSTRKCTWSGEQY